MMELCVAQMIIQGLCRSDWTCIATTKCYKILESLSNKEFSSKWHFGKTYGLS